MPSREGADNFVRQIGEHLLVERYSFEGPGETLPEGTCEFPIEKRVREPSHVSRLPVWWHPTVAGLLIAVIAILDVMRPSASMFYLIPALYVGWSMRGRVEWTCYLVVALTVFLVPVLVTPSRATQTRMLNRALGVGMSLLVAYVVGDRRQFADRLQRSNKELAVRGAKRAFELETTIRFLGQRELRLRTILDSQPECVQLLDSAGFVLEMNRAGLAMVGAESLDQLVGKSIYPLVSAEFRKQFQELTESVFRGDPGTLEFEIVGLTGNRLWLESHASPLRTADGRITAVLAITRDITQRRRAVEAVRESQQLLSSVARALPHWIYIFDFDESRITYSNNSILSDLGYSPEIVGQDLSWEMIANYMTPEERPRLARMLDEWKVLPDGQLREDEYHLRHADGTVHSFAGRETVFARRADGTVRQVLGTLADITTSKLVEAALRQSEQQFSLFMRHLPGLAWIKDVQGRYLFANAAAEKAFGFPLADIVGRTDDELFAPETAAQFKAADQQAVTSGSEVRTIESLKHQDGSLHHSIVSKFSLPSCVGETLVGGMAIDITEQKRAEETIRRISAFRETIVRTAAEGICVCYAVPEFPHVRFSVWNEQMTELTGYTMEEINRLGWYQSMYPDGEIQERAKSRMAQMRYGKDIRAEEWEIIRKDGARRLLAISTSIVETEEDRHAVVALMQDITARKQGEETLRESEERFRLLFEGANDAIFWADAESGLLTHCNAAAENLVGRDRSEIIGQPQSFLHPPEEAERYREIFRAHATSRSRESIEVEVLRSDGRRANVSISPSVTMIGGQRIIQGIFRDITERKRSEESLRESEERFQAFMNQNPLVAWVKDDEYRYRYVNSAFARLFDRPLSEILGRTDYDIYDQQYADQTRANDIVVMQSEKSLDTIEKVPGADGRLRHWLVQKFPLRRSRGRFWVGGTAADVTDRIEAQEALRTSEARLQAVIRHAPNVAIQWYDSNGRVILWNEASEAVFGYSAAEAIGKTLDQLIHTPEETAVFRAALAGISRTGKSIGPTEYSFHRRNGEPGTCLSNIFMIPGDDQSDWFVSMDVDVTERKRLEADLSLRQRELLHASRLNAIGQMVAGLSHEVAQPLNAIANFARGSASLLNTANFPQSETLKEYIQAITDQSRRCGAILQRLRDYSRRAPSRQKSCELNPILIESTELIAPELRRNNVSVGWELASELPPISADRIQIQQVVFNLLNNALDAVRDQERSRRLITIRSSEEHETVMIEIEDHGAGIASEVFQHLFQPFFTTKEDGMGIGLNICETIVRNHGGRIEASSNKFNGATFRVRLPALQKDLRASHLAREIGDNE